MTKRNWVVPEGCTYVVDLEAKPSTSDLRHYGGYLVAESIFHEDDLALILAAPAQAERISDLEDAMIDGDFDYARAGALVLNHEGHIERLNKRISDLEDELLVTKDELESLKEFA